MRKVILKTIKNTLLVFFFLTVFASPLFGQTAARPWWYSLEQGKLKFRSGDYGGALLSFEDARRQRRAMYEQMERDLINLLSVNEVRRLGDSLDWVERYSYERHYAGASAALEELYYRVPKTELNNSASAALAAIGGLKDYPEAEYWIGEIYRIEGELPLALSQFRKAYDRRDLLENQDFSHELLYKIAAILKTRQEYNEMEKVLLSITADYDSLWTDTGKAEVSRIEAADKDPPYAQASASFAVQSMTRILEKEGAVRFLEMYRYNNSLAEPAHRILGFYYAVSGRPSAQQHLMFAFLIQNTVILEEVKRRRFDFVFNDFTALAEEINRSSLLSSYIREVEYYKTFFYLGASLYRNGKTTVARDIWTFLASRTDAGEWQNRALVQLRNPHMEPLVEMP